MTYDFNTITDRKGTNAIKYDLALTRGKPADALPLWVADMDFPTAPEILKALHDKVSHGIFGYSAPCEDFYEAVKKWQKEEHDFSVERKWILTTPGVVFAIVSAIRAFTEKGEAVLIQTPVYYPFKNMILANERKLVTSSLFEKDGKWQIDFEDFERKIVENDVKLFVLCSPTILWAGSGDGKNLSEFQKSVSVTKSLSFPTRFTMISCMSLTGISSTRPFQKRPLKTQSWRPPQAKLSTWQAFSSLSSLSRTHS